MEADRKADKNIDEEREGDKNPLGKKRTKTLNMQVKKTMFFFVEQIIILYRRMQARSPISLPSQYAFANG